MILALGLDELKTYVPPKTTKEAIPAVTSRKRKSPPLQDMEDEDESDAKVSKTRAAQDITNTFGVRRSARHAGKVVNYKSEIVTTPPEVISTANTTQPCSKKDTHKPNCRKELASRSNG